MTLGSKTASAWRAAREELARLDRLLAETGNSDDDFVFHIRRSEREPQRYGSQSASTISRYRLRRAPRRLS